MDVALRVVKSTAGSYFTTLGTKENCPKWDYDVVGTGRAKPTQSEAIEEGRLAARMLGHKVVLVKRWRNPPKPKGMLKNEETIWVRATRMRDQTDLPSRKFARVILSNGEITLVLRKYTSRRSGAARPRRTP